MKLNVAQGFRNLIKRDWIRHNEGRLTYVQMFGFLLITLGVIYSCSFLLPSGIIDFFSSLKLEDTSVPEGVSIAFFTIMLGVAFAFPDMLKGQTKDISTMRIIVFMFANVICMLLLKIGWDKHSLQEIGLDGYWMGVIAFLFGAKATQAYFENIKSLAPQTTSAPAQNNISNIAIAQLAKVQNEESLHEKFPNIEFVSDTLKDEKSYVTIYVKDDNVSGIPTTLEAAINSNYKVNVPVEMVTNVGEGVPHIFAQLSNDIADSKTPAYLGSICCLVDSVVNPGFKGAVTSGHVFTNGKFDDYQGFVKTSQVRDAFSNGHSIGQLYFQQMTSNQDLAVVELKNNSALLKDFQSYANGFYEVSTADLNSPVPNVTILSKDNNKRDAYILDFNVTMRIYYGGVQKFVRNIILIGSENIKNNSKTVSEGGDSGSSVYHTASNKIIGMLLGGNDKFSFVLPFKETLQANNFKIK